MKELTPIHRKKQYEDKIAPLVRQLDLMLKSEGIPYFFSACVENGEDGTEYIHDGNLCGSNGFVLKDDKITDYFRILCGFRLVSHEETEGGYSVLVPEEPIELDMEKL